MQNKRIQTRTQDFLHPQSLFSDYIPTMSEEENLNLQPLGQ